MIKMFITSFYNTLINTEEAISTSTIIEIDKLRNKNILLTICTNRTKEEVLYYNKDYPFIDYIIAYNGNYIYDVKRKKDILKTPLKKNIIKQIEKIYQDYNLSYYKENNEIYKIEIKVSKKELNIIEKISDIDVNKSILFYKNEYFIEITEKNISNAVETLLKKLNINYDETIAVIGNDSEKLLTNIIKNTYAVSNASKNLKEKVNNKTTSNCLKGVEKVIKKYNK